MLYKNFYIKIKYFGGSIMSNVKEEFQEAWEICKLLKVIPVEDKLRLQGMMMLLKEQNKEKTKNSQQPK